MGPAHNGQIPGRPRQGFHLVVERRPGVQRYYPPQQVRAAFFFFSSFVLFHPVGRLLFEKINLNKIKEIKKKEAEKKCR